MPFSGNYTHPSSMPTTIHYVHVVFVITRPKRKCKVLSRNLLKAFWPQTAKLCNKGTGHFYVEDQYSHLGYIKNNVYA